MASMFVSLLQLMGFPVAEPVHSRAEEMKPSPAGLTAPVTNPGKTLETIASVQSEQNMSARRSSVKAQASNTQAKVAAKPAPSKVVKAVKAAPVKSAKVEVKVAPKPAAKAIAKPQASSKAASSPAKSEKPAVSARLAPVKSSKVAAKAVVAKPKAAKPVAKQVTKPVPMKSEPLSKSNPTPVKAVPVAKPVAVEPVLTASGVPVRSGRPSSRLAQLTVPSMAQSIASTAAKASFTQITATQPIVSPLASATKRNPKLANNWKTKSLPELTDEEIIAMSDDLYMNDTQLAYFRLKLVTLKDSILNSAGETTEHLREDTVVVPDPADRATIEEEHALELRTRDRERKLLKKIEQSIDRIDAGDYGYCDETGEPIGVGRLLARPTATLSLEAQQRRELKQKMFGD
jgi:DnaK suppressor protein